MSRHQARVTVRPDLRRLLLTGIAIAVVSLGWASAALAQDVAATTERISAATSPALVVAVSNDALAQAPVTMVNAPVGPVMTTSAVRFVPSQSRETITLDERMQDRKVGLGRNLALVVVGVAAMVIGADVDDAPGDLLVIGGAGMTLYGLYQILR